MSGGKTAANSIIVKSIIVVVRPISSEEAEEIKQANLVVYSYETTNLEFYGIAHTPIVLDSEKLKKAQHSSLQYITNFPSRAYSKSTVGHLFQIEGANMWFYNKFRISEEFVKSGIIEAAVAEVCENVEIIKLYLATDIPLRSSPTLKIEKTFLSKDSGSLSFSWSNLYVYLQRAIRSLFRNVGCKDHLLLYSAVRRQNILSMSTDKVKNEFTQLLYLKEQFKDTLSPLEELPFPELKGKQLDYKNYKKPYEEDSIMAEYVVVKKLLNPFCVIKVVREIEQLKKRLRGFYELADDYRDKWIIKRSLGFSMTNYLHLFRYLGYVDFFKNHKFKSVIAVDENSSLQKVVLDAAKQYGVKTYGIQHGVIHSLHPAYMFSTKDFENFSPVPDKTFLWGEHWQKIAVENGGYPRSKVEVVGQVRTDIIPTLKSKPEQVPYVVFASQPLFDQELKYQVWKALFDGMRGLEGIKLVIKPHPIELKLEHYLATHFAGEVGNYEIERVQDLYEILSTCSALITCSSTVAVETVYFHKPLVILDPYMEDMMGFVSAGLGHLATNGEDLNRLLAKCLNGNLLIDKEKYDDYLKRYAMAIDGKVCRRIMNCIEQG